jgi:hypothetical protein
MERAPASMTPERTARLLVDLGAVLQHAQGGAAGPPLTRLAHADLATKARRLLAFAVDMGWPATAARMLPLACAGCACSADVVASIHRANPCDGLNLVHRAVRSGSLPVLRGLLAWGEHHGYDWRPTLAGPHGITPLHLAALLDDAGAAALALIDAYGPAAMAGARTADAVTPFHMAFQMGHHTVDRLLRALKSDAAAARLLACHTTAAGGVDIQRPAAPSAPPATGRGAAAAAAAAAGARNRPFCGTDPCEVCQSTLPPLLLTVMAHCASCGKRKRVGADGGGRPQHGHGHGHSHHHEPSAGAGDCCELARAVTRRQHTAAHPDNDACTLCCEAENPRHSSVFSITAVCQSCHANRQMEVV